MMTETRGAPLVIGQLPTGQRGEDQASASKSIVRAQRAVRALPGRYCRYRGASDVRSVERVTTPSPSSPAAEFQAASPQAASHAREAPVATRRWLHRIERLLLLAIVDAFTLYLAATLAYLVWARPMRDQSFA